MTDQNVTAIIVLYEPPETVAQMLQLIAPQVGQVIVVDNGANSHLSAQFSEVIWLKNPENGLAKAQNLGISHARQSGAKAVLLLDDDSMPDAKMVEHLLAIRRQSAVIAVPYLKEEALDHPPYYIQQGGWLGFKRVTFGSQQTLENLYFAAASGSLIPLEIIDKVGEMREEFFIYFIDTDFCLRARKAGFDVVAVRDAILTHRIGKRSTHHLLGKTISTTNHPAKARYLMMRNRRKLLQEYGFSQAGYALFDTLRIISEFLRVMAFESDKKAKLDAMVKGLFS